MLHAATNTNTVAFALSGVIRTRSAVRRGNVESMLGWMYMYSIRTGRSRSRLIERKRCGCDCGRRPPGKGFRAQKQIEMLVQPPVWRIGNRFLLGCPSSFVLAITGHSREKLRRSHLFPGETGNGRRTGRCCFLCV